jgi:hypothetical protein
VLVGVAVLVEVGSGVFVGVAVAVGAAGGVYASIAFGGSPLQANPPMA